MTPEQVVASYRRSLAESGGETLIFRRYTGAGENRPFFDYPPVPARIRGATAKELVGSLAGTEREAIVLVADLTTAGVALPRNATGWKVLVDGRECAIVSVDDQTRKVAGVLIAIVVRISGP
jgi:hypothetical protein